MLMNPISKDIELTSIVKLKEVFYNTMYKVNVLLDYIDKELEKKTTVFIPKEVFDTLSISPKNLKDNLEHDVKIIIQTRHFDYEEGWLGNSGYWFDKIEKRK